MANIVKVSMGNIIKIHGISEQSKIRLIRDMVPGEMGYTVEWAIDEKTGNLDENYSVGKKGGTASVKVECIEKGKYIVTFEKPIYRDIITGEYQ